MARGANSTSGASSWSPVTHRVVIAHTSDTLESWDFCRGVASYRPRSGVWGLRSIPIKDDASPAHLRGIAEAECDGIIMMPGLEAALKPMHARGVKVVDVDGPGDAHPYAQIRLDNVFIGQLAGEHLLERGFARVAYLGEGSPWSMRRAEGLRRVVAERQAEYVPLYASNWGQLTSPAWIARALRRVPRPFGLMACDDVVAAHAVRAIVAEGWHVPIEIGVIGVDDRITECIGVQPPLSSISTERERIGHEAARMLDEIFMGKNLGGKLRHFRPLRVSERESTAGFACADRDVAAAIAFIRREACNGITIDDVVNHGHLTRRTLERRFAEYLHRSPGEEIRRVRLDAVKRAIERTHMPLADIAAMCGFSCASAMSHSFHASTGMFPLAYRKKARATGIEP